MSPLLTATPVVVGASRIGGAALRALGDEVGAAVAETGVTRTGVAVGTRGTVAVGRADEPGVAATARFTNTDAFGVFPPHALSANAPTPRLASAETATRNRCDAMQG